MKFRKDHFDIRIINHQLQTACYETEAVIGKFLGWEKAE